MNIASFITITPAANSKDWLDMTIHIPLDVERWRWKWLGLIVIGGAMIPLEGKVADEIAALFPPLLACFILACWHRSSAALKAILALGAGLAVFLHRDLPLPGIGYGAYQLLAHAFIPETQQKWLLISLGLQAVLPMLMVVFIHYLILAASIGIEFLNTVRQKVWHLLFDIPGATDRSPSVKQAHVDISS